MNGFTRPYSFGVNMLRNGYHTTVFSASYLHFSDVNIIEGKSLYKVDRVDGIPFVFTKTPSSAGSGLKRVSNMFMYYKNLFKVVKNYASTGEAPDVIIASSPHPLAMVAGIKIARKFKVPCVCEVRDFWPEVFFMGGKLKEKSLLGKLLVAGEHWIYKNADAIIFLKEGDVTYITDKKWDVPQGGDINLDKCFYINNGVDVNNFVSRKKDSELDDADLKTGKFNVVYAGAIRPVNNVGNILDAAHLLKDYKDIQFLIYGDGNQLGFLRQRVSDEGLRNVKLKGYIEKRYMPYVLSKSSVNILNYAQDKYNWSRGNSSNKLFEYMASGRPIISTVKMGYCPLTKYQCGLSLDNDTPDALAKAVLEIYEMPEKQYDQMSENAKNGAKDFDYAVLTEKLISVMESLVS
jgi:glycosyltransferase involved in cell wall biosynthesis